MSTEKSRNSAGSLKIPPQIKKKKEKRKKKRKRRGKGREKTRIKQNNANMYNVMYSV